MAMFDLEKTATLAQLFTVPNELRDTDWTRAFYQAAPDASLAAREQQIVQGPDGAGYFALYLPPAEQEFEAFCIRHILAPCLEHDVGCVINPDKPQPDWVFRYGSLWSLHSYNTFDASTPGQAQTEPVAGREVLIAAPSEQFLPGFARKVLRHFLENAGISDPRVLLMCDANATPSQSLAFSLYPDELGEEKFNAIMDRLRGWYLPPHYGLLVLPRDAAYERHFVPL